MSHSVDTFIVSVEVKHLIADGPPDATNPPSSKRAPEQKAATGSVEGSAFIEDAEKAIVPLRCLRGAALSHALLHVIWLQKGGSARFFCVLSEPNPRV